MTAAHSAVFFDLDGTLLDTNYLHTWAWWLALSDAGVAVTMSQVHRLIGKGGQELLVDIVGHTDERISRSHSENFARFQDRIRPLPGAIELIHRVHQHGARVTVVTSAEEEELQLLLKPLACDDVIDDIVHGGTVDSAKPAPDLFNVALSRSNAQPADAIAVGDTRWDILAACRAGIRCVAVETGGVAACELSAAGATAVYPSCQALFAGYDTSVLASLA